MGFVGYDIDIPYDLPCYTVYIYILSGWWFETFCFSIQLGRIIPTDFHIFQRG